MTTRRRDLHGRGLRGPIALPNPLTGSPVRPAQPANRVAYFAECVSDSLDRIGEHCPQALRHITFGVEDVPTLDRGWVGERVPLAAAVAGTPQEFARVVVYRRPLEHRARNREGLRILVHRTIVEQVAALTGLEVATIDPDAVDDD